MHVIDPTTITDDDAPKKEPVNKEERARRAVREFTKQLRALSQTARALTGKPYLNVYVTGGTPHTDGKNIYMRPPIELGDRYMHVRSKCDQRDPITLEQQCAACRIREAVQATLYHEMAHNIEDSFQTVNLDDARIRDVVIKSVKRYHGKSDVADRVLKRIERRRQASRQALTFIEVAGLVSPYLPSILNALEDGRINRRISEARPGLKIMFHAQAKSVFEQGIKGLDGEISYWGQAPRNAQAIIAMYLKVMGYDFTGWLSPEVEADVAHDQVLDELCESIRYMGEASGVYETLFPIVARLKELGYLLDNTDPAPDDEDEPMPGGQGDDEDDQESDDDDAEQSGDNESSGSDSEPEPDDDESGGDDAGSESAGGVSAEADDQDGGESADGDGEGDGGDAAEDDDEEGGTGGSEGEEDDGDGDASGDGSDEAGGEEDGSGGRTDDEPADDGDAVGGGSDDDTDADDSDAGEDDVEADGGSGDGESDEDSGAGGGAGEPSDDADSPAEPPPSGIDGQPWEPDADPIDPPDLEDVERAVDEGRGHKAGSPGEIDYDKASGAFGGRAAGDIEAEEEADHFDGEPLEEDWKRAISQVQHFDRPSENIGGVTIFDKDHEFWKHRLTPGAGKAMIEQPDESCMTPALAHMRRVFTDNLKFRTERNLKRGRINPRSLGRRAPFDDPRLMQKREIPGKRSYFVLIGVDVSFSNQINGTLPTVKMAVAAQADLLARMGVEFAIYAHSSDYDMASYSISLGIFIIKERDEPWSEEHRDRLAAISPNGGNLDGHTMEFYRKRFAESRATDKVLMYYCDGQMPDGNYQEELAILKDELATMRRMGVTTMGVGIGSTSPTEHGLDTVMVNRAADVPLVVKHLEKVLAR